MVPATMALVPPVLFVPSVGNVPAILLIPIVTSEPAISAVLFVPSQLMVLFVSVALAMVRAMMLVFSAMSLRMMPTVLLLPPIIETAFPTRTMPMPVAGAMPFAPPVAPMAISRDPNSFNDVVLRGNQIAKFHQVATYIRVFSNV